MADRRLLEYHIGRLTNKNAEIRIKSIGELRLLDDPDGWAAITQSYATEADPAVQQAGRSALSAYAISLLKQNPTASTRLALIAQLQQLADPDALPVLEQVYHTDSDPAVRQAAREAGYAIFTRQKQSG